MMKAFEFGFFTGVAFLFGCILSNELISSNYEDFYAVVKEEQCVIGKPSGTVCVYEGSWVAKPIENEGE